MFRTSTFLASTQDTGELAMSHCDISDQCQHQMVVMIIMICSKFQTTSHKYSMEVLLAITHSTVTSLVFHHSSNSSHVMKGIKRANRSSVNMIIEHITNVIHNFVREMELKWHKIFKLLNNSPCCISSNSQMHHKEYKEEHNSFKNNYYSSTNMIICM